MNPKTTVGADGEIRGYTVSLPGDVTADGTPVTYSGTKLAADLTWPKLMTRWASTPAAAPIERTEDGRVSRAERQDALEHAATIVGRATVQVRESGGDVDGIAHAAGEVFAALARGREGREPGPLAEIAERYDRAGRTPHRVLPARIGPVARDLRQASRRIAAAGALSGRGKEKFAGLALLLALASLVAEIAAWQQMRGRVHQAAAARRAADLPPLPVRSRRRRRAERRGDPTTRASRPLQPNG